MSEKNTEIEALRAVAIGSNLCQHFPLLFPALGGPDWLRWIYEHVAFWCGADLFFTVSGFVVASSLMRGLERAQNEGVSRWGYVKRFWVRRVFRLFPQAWFWLIVVLLGCIYFNRSVIFGTIEANLKQALMITFYVYNWFVYWLNAANVTIAPLGVYWSLAVEEQFYIVLPILFLLFRTRSLIVLLLFAIAAQFFIWRPAPWYEPWWGLRCETLAWGVLLAFFARTPRFAVLRQRATMLATRKWAAWLVNIALMFALVVLPWRFFNVSFITGLVAIACMIWVGLAIVEHDLTLPGIAHKPWVQWLGNRSYAIYLSHFPAYMCVHEIAFRLDAAGIITFGWHWVPCAVALALMLAALGAELTHWLIEDPLRDYGRRMSERVR